MGGGAGKPDPWAVSPVLLTLNKPWVIIVLVFCAHRLYVILFQKYICSCDGGIIECVEFSIMIDEHLQ